MNINRQITCDVLIVGSGIAGLTAAQRAVNIFKKVCLATTGKICGGASYFPLKGTLGIQASKGKDDYSKYYEDIITQSRGAGRLLKIPLIEWFTTHTVTREAGDDQPGIRVRRYC